MDISNNKLKLITTPLIIGAIVTVELWPNYAIYPEWTSDVIPDNSHTPNELVVLKPIESVISALPSGSTISTVILK